MKFYAVTHLLKVYCFVHSIILQLVQYQARGILIILISVHYDDLQHRNPVLSACARINEIFQSKNENDTASGFSQLKLWKTKEHNPSRVISVNVITPINVYNFS